MTRPKRLWTKQVTAALAIAAAGAGCDPGAAGDIADPDRASVARPIVGPAPDYVVAALSNPPGAALNGAAFSIAATVENRGDAGAVASSITRYFLSSDRIIGSDSSIVKSAVVPPLDIGATDTQTITLAIPSGVAGGSYFIIACADRTKKVPELSDANNCTASASAVAITGPDLMVETLSDPPPQLYPGDSFSISDMIRNAGTAAADSSTVAYYLSIIPARGPQAHRLARRRNTGPIGAGAASSGTTAFKVLAMPPGSYYLIACADLQGAIAESNEQNNCRAAAGTLTIPVIDLVISSLGDPPASVVAGEGFSVADTTANTGTLATPSSTTRFFLSLDELPDAGVAAVGSRTVPELPAAGASSGTTQITIDFATPPGDYFLFACADFTGLIAELSEANNCRASAARVAVAEPEPAEVTIRLLGRTGRGGPGPDVPVLVHGRDGSLVARLATDASGAVNATVPPGGSVTVVELLPRYLTTFRGVKSGVDLTVGDKLGDYPFFLGTAPLTVPAGAPPDTWFKVEGECVGTDFSTSPEVTALLWGACGSATGPVMATLSDSFDGSTLRGYLYDPALTLVPDVAALLEGDWLPPIAFSIAVTGIPEDLNRPDLMVGRLLGSRIFYRWQLNWMHPVSFTDGVFSGSVPMATGGDGILTHLQFGHHEILEYRVTDIDSYETDVMDDLVAWPRDGALVHGELEPGGPVDVVGLQWTTVEGAAVDGIVLRIEKDDAVPVAWTVVAPPSTAGANELHLPRLPADLVPVWSGGKMQGVHFLMVDTPATSFSEFARDAEPEMPWQWMWWRPTAPGKVRIGRLM